MKQRWKRRGKDGPRLTARKRPWSPADLEGLDTWFRLGPNGPLLTTRVGGVLVTVSCDRKDG